MNELATTESAPLAPATQSAHMLAHAKEHYNTLVEFVKLVMRDGIDYGIIPGTSNKKVLLKPGMEKLATLFGLSARPTLLEKVEDWTGADHGGEPFFTYRYRMELWKGDYVAGSGEGSCNSWEKKYRYRSTVFSCPQCQNETLKKGAAKFGGGYYCDAKSGGCGARFQDNDQRVPKSGTAQKNPDPAEQANTILKMAQKRALGAAVLVTVNASEFFTVDPDDRETIDANFEVLSPEPPKTPIIDPLQKGRSNASPSETPAVSNPPAGEFSFNSKGKRRVNGQDAGWNFFAGEKKYWTADEAVKEFCVRTMGQVLIVEAKTDGEIIEARLKSV